MASLPNPKPVTYAEWLEMPEVEDGIEEVVDGEIILTPPAKNLPEPGPRRLSTCNAGPKDGYMRSPPQLAVEVLSPSERRSFTARKLQDYEDVKTPEVWVISPRDRTVEIYLLEGETLERAAIVSAGLLKPQAFPHVQIDIAGIWPD